MARRRDRHGADQTWMPQDQAMAALAVGGGAGAAAGPVGGSGGGLSDGVVRGQGGAAGSLGGGPIEGTGAAENGRALRTLALIAVVVGLVALTTAACVLTYSSVHDFALQAGILPSLAKIYPDIGDAMLVMAGCSVLALRGAGLPSRMYGWLCFILLLGALAGASVAHEAGLNMPKRAAEITAAVFPWALVLVAFGLLLTLLRHARRRRQTHRANAAEGAALTSSRAALEPPALESAVLEAGLDPGGYYADAHEAEAYEPDAYEPDAYQAAGEGEEYEGGDYGSEGSPESAEWHEDAVTYEYHPHDATSQYPPAEPAPAGEPSGFAAPADPGTPAEPGNFDGPGAPSGPLPRPTVQEETPEAPTQPKDSSATAAEAPPAEPPPAEPTQTETTPATQPPRAAVRPTEMQLRARAQRLPRSAEPQTTEPPPTEPPPTEPPPTEPPPTEPPPTEPPPTEPQAATPRQQSTALPTGGLPAGESPGGGYTSDTIPRGELNPAPTVDPPDDSAEPEQASDDRPQPSGPTQGQPPRLDRPRSSPTPPS